MRGKKIKILNVHRDIKPEWRGAGIPRETRALYHVVTPETFGAKKFWLGYEIIDVGRTTLLHAHSIEEAYFILSGEGLVWGEDEEHEVRANDVVFFAPGVKHSIKNIGNCPLIFIWVYSPIPTEVTEQKFLKVAERAKESS